MNFCFWKKKPAVKTPVTPVMSFTTVQNGKFVCSHLAQAEFTQGSGTANLTLTPPANDGVYQGDGSPPIGTYKWRKPLSSDGKMHITFAVAIPVNGTLVNIPDSHNLLIAIKAAFETIQQTCMLWFDQIPYAG